MGWAGASQNKRQYDSKVRTKVHVELIWLYAVSLAAAYLPLYSCTDGTTESAS